MDKHKKLIEHIKGIRKVIINDCFGGYGLSHDAVLAYLDRLNRPVWPEFDKKFKGLGLVTYWLIPPGPNRVKSDPDNWHEMSIAERIAHNQAYSQQVFDTKSIARDDPYLVQIIEEMGETANGRHAKLKILTIPADVDWQIEEYDGNEWIAEKHRTWR